MGETKGTAKKGVGWLTGDRQVEAEGRIEEQSEDAPTDEQAVQEETEQVKAEHGDYGTPAAPR